MSKSLETEYKQHIENTIPDLPDLWNRIENSLPEKVVNQKVVNIDSSRKTVNKRKITGKNITMIGGIAAACVAGVVILPVLLRGNLKNEIATATEAGATMDLVASEEVDYTDAAMDDYEDESYSEDWDNYAESEMASEEAYYADEAAEESYAMEENSFEANEANSETDISQETYADADEQAKQEDTINPEKKSNKTDNSLPVDAEEETLPERVYKVNGEASGKGVLLYREDYTAVINSFKIYSEDGHRYIKVTDYICSKYEKKFGKTNPVIVIDITDYDNYCLENGYSRIKTGKSYDINFYLNGDGEFILEGASFQ